jgi:hypothetical protein
MLRNMYAALWAAMSAGFGSSNFGILFTLILIDDEQWQNKDYSRAWQRDATRLDGLTIIDAPCRARFLFTPFSNYDILKL